MTATGIYLARPEPPCSNRAGHCDSRNVLDDHVGPVKAEQEQDICRNIPMICLDVSLAFIRFNAIIRVARIYHAHQGNGPNQTPQKGDQQSGRSQQDNVRRTPHGAHGRVQIRRRKGNSMPTVDGIPERQDQCRKSHERNETIWIRKDRATNSPCKCQDDGKDQNYLNQGSCHNEHKAKGQVRNDAGVHS
jgi:hypothetical protein